MHIVLLAIGVVVVVVGLALIGLGLAGALGHTLVVTGTVAAIGSLILSSLATVTRQLRRIAQSLEMRPVGRAATPEPEEEAPSPTASRAAPPLQAPVVEPPVAPAYEPAPEPEVRIEPKVEPLPEPVHAAAPEPVPEVAEQPPEVSVDEPAPLAPKPEPDRSFDAVWSGALDRPARDTAPAAVAAGGVAVVEAMRPAPAAPPSVPEVGIFKSGVIDGMAYTLYTDGSIEAELPQGTVKFASIDELRAYLTARE